MNSYTQLTELWVSQIQNTSPEVQVEWTRTCAQWVCGLLPWKGRKLTYLAEDARRLLWRNDQLSIDWNQLSRQIIEQIPHEDEIENFSLPDAIFEAVMAILAYACQARVDHSEKNIRSIIVWTLDAVAAPVDFSDLSYEAQDEQVLNTTVLDEIWESRESESDLVKRAQAWRNQFYTE